MRYRLITQPTAGPGKVTEELVRLLKNAKRLTTSLVVVGPPHKRVPMTATVLEIPDQSAPMATRVLEVVLGPSGHFEPQQAITTRDEWITHALLVPQKGAQPLVETLFEGWSSVCLHVHWRPGRCVGVIHYCESDAARVAALAAHGWKARVLPAKAVEANASLRLSMSWVGRVSHQPFLGKPLVTPTAQPVIAVTSGGRTMTPASLFSAHQGSVFETDPSNPVKLGQIRPTGIGTVLAPRGGDGFPLGTTLDGQAVQLAWHALLLAVVAPEDRQRDMVRTLVTRAIQHNLGLIAVIPQSLVSSRQLAAWSARVRVLDPRNLWESHAIPWHLIDPLLLREALAAAGVDSTPTLPLPTTFGEFLSTLPGGEQYCSESVLALTAPEGDDLRSVVEAGGGVLLIDDASPGSRLLSMLLFALLATPPINRRMLLIRPAQILVPAALAQRSMQVVFGEEAAALGTLRAASDSWRLTHADGSPATDLDADLDRAPSTLDETSYGSLMDTLTGDSTGRQTSGLPEPLPVQSIGGMTPLGTGIDDDDPFAIPFVTPAAAAGDDDLFTFDSAPAAPPALLPVSPQPNSAGNAFNSFFNFPLDEEPSGAAALSADDWMMVSPAPGGNGGVPDEIGGEFALPTMPDAGADTAFVDFFGQPLDKLAAPPPVSAADADTALDSHGVRDQAAVGTDDPGLDLFATLPDFGGIPATASTPDAGAFGMGPDVLSSGSIFPSLSTPDAGAFGIGPDVLSNDSIFPSCTAEPWELKPTQPQDGLGDPFLNGFGSSTVDDVGVEDRTTSQLTETPAADEAPAVQIIPADFQGWQAQPGAVATWASTPWLVNPPATPTDLPVGQAEPGAATPVGDTPWWEELASAAGAAPEPLAAVLVAPEEAGQALTAAVSEIDASAPRVVSAARRAQSRRRRGWMPPRRGTIAAGTEEGAVRADTTLSEQPDADAQAAQAPGASGLPATALFADDADQPLDPVTLALANGDLDLTALPLFDGAEFALPPVTASEPLADTTEPLPDANGSDLPAISTIVPSDYLIDFLREPFELRAEPTTSAEPRALVEERAADDEQPAPARTAEPALPERAGLDLLAEQPSAQTVDLLISAATDAPDTQQLIVAVAAPPASLAPAAAGEPPIPALNARLGITTSQSTSTDLTFDADAVHAAWCVSTGMGELVDLVARQNPGADRSSIRRTIRALLDARTAAGTAGSVLPTRPLWSVGALNGPHFGIPSAPAAPAGEQLTAPQREAHVEAPLMPAMALDMVGEPGTQEILPAAALIRDLPASSVATEQPASLGQRSAALDDALMQPSDDDSLISDTTIWDRWSSNVELVEIMRAISGYTRGRAADLARDRVYRVVAPRIVDALNADVLVTRLLLGRTPLPSQMPQFEDVLKQLNRQSSQVNGVVREKTIARLIASMREAREQIGAVA